MSLSSGELAPGCLAAFFLRVVFPMRIFSSVWLALALASTVPGLAHAESKVEVQERIGTQIPSTLTFVDHDGKSVRISDFLVEGKPVILNLVYYNCPLLCNLLLNGFIEGLNQGTGIPDQGLNIITVSIDPREGPELGRAKRASYLNQLKNKQLIDHWTFMTGEGPAIRELADAVGFKYRFDNETTEYLHPATIMFLDGSGQIVRYLHGTYFPPDQIRLAWNEAGGGALAERVAAWFFPYDEASRKYVRSEHRAMFVSLGLAMVLFGPVLFLIFRSRKKSLG